MRMSKAYPETRLKSGKENYGYSSDEARASREYQAGTGRPTETSPASQAGKPTHWEQSVFG